MAEFEVKQMADTTGRFIAPEKTEEEVMEASLRPRTLDEFVGQDALKAKLKVFVSAARQRGEALDHILLCGPPGLGKTTLAHILARELGVEIRQTSGPALEKKGDLAGILTNLAHRDVLFIEIGRAHV